MEVAVRDGDRDALRANLAQAERPSDVLDLVVKKKDAALLEFVMDELGVSLPEDPRLRGTLLYHAAHFTSTSVRNLEMLEALRHRGCVRGAPGKC